jgi:polar amino acid transport system substrate-binding protein
MKTKMASILAAFLILVTLFSLFVFASPPPYVTELAPTGKLRIALWSRNSNFLAKNQSTGELTGIWPELAHELASRLGITYTIVGTDSIIGPYAVLKNNEADIAFTEKAIGLDDPHTNVVDVTPPYVQLPVTILVRAGSSIHALADLNRPGIRIATPKDSAADVILTCDYKQAQVVRTTGGNYYDLVKDGQAEAAAGPLSGELNYIGSSSDYRILKDPLFINTQLIALPKGHPAALAYLRAFVEDVKASGLIQRLIDRSGKKGITVAPMAP